jgi:hypothetical protein
VLAIISTLKEVLFLWVRNFWYLVVLAFLFGVPDFFLRQLDHDYHASQFKWSPLLGFIVSTALLWLDTVNLTAIFGLLKKEPSESVWMAAWQSIKAYTWTLFRLVLLIGLVCIPVVGISVAIIHILSLAKAGMFLVLGAYLVFIISALAGPLVVVENLGAMDALKRSWGMTKRHFLYVAGCYLILGLMEWLIHWMITLLSHTTDNEMNWAGLMMKVVSEVIDSAWIILLWSMYLKIKAEEEQMASVKEAVAN